MNLDIFHFFLLKIFPIIIQLERLKETVFHKVKVNTKFQ